MSSGRFLHVIQYSNVRENKNGAPVYKHSVVLYAFIIGDFEKKSKVF